MPTGAWVDAAAVAERGAAAGLGEARTAPFCPAWPEGQRRGPGAGGSSGGYGFIWWERAVYSRMASSGPGLIRESLAGVV